MCLCACMYACMQSCSAPSGRRKFWLHAFRLVTLAWHMEINIFAKLHLEQAQIIINTDMSLKQTNKPATHKYAHQNLSLNQINSSTSIRSILIMSADMPSSLSWYLPTRPSTKILYVLVSQISAACPTHPISLH